MHEFGPIHEKESSRGITEQYILQPTTDLKWLEQLAGRDIPPNEIESMHPVLAIGIAVIDPNGDLDRIGEVKEARRVFFEDLLGWGSELHPLHAAYSTIEDHDASTIPLRTFIDNQRLLHSRAINPVAVLSDFPKFLFQSASKTSEVFAHFDEIGLNIKKVVNGYPRAMSFTPSRIQTVADFYQQNGLNIIKIMNSDPSSLGLPVSRVNDVLTNLNEQGLPASKVINGYPGILSYSNDTVATKISFLDDQGLDSRKVCSQFPTVLGLSTETITRKLQVLASLGYEPTTLVNAFPVIIGLSSESITRKTRLITGLLRVVGSSISGPDAVKVFPGLLGRSDAKLAAVARFVSTHGTTDTIPDSAKTIRDLVMLPIESHLDAARDMNRPYSAATVQAKRVAVPNSDRKEITEEILADSKSCLLIGDECIKAYRRASRK